MTTRRRTLAAALGLALIAVGAPTAAAANSSGADGAALNRSLDVGATELVNGSLFGEVTVVPGHFQTRTLTVRNAGELDGILNVSIVNASHEVGLPNDYFDEILVNGRTASSLAGNETVVQTVALPAGEAVGVPVSIRFDGATGTTAVHDEQTFRFDVRLVLSGETPSQPDETPDADDQEVSAPDRTPDEPAPPVSGPLAQTGGEIAGSSMMQLLMAAALAIGGLLALVPAFRRRKDADER
jgi:hypothetical protein